MAAFDPQFNVQSLLWQEGLLPFNASAPARILVQRYRSLDLSWTSKASYRF